MPLLRSLVSTAVTLVCSVQLLFGITVLCAQEESHYHLPISPDEEQSVELQTKRRPYISKQTLYCTAAGGLAGLAAGAAVTGGGGTPEAKKPAEPPASPKPPGPLSQFPTKQATLEFRFITESTPGSNAGTWRGVVIQPDQQVLTTQALSTENNVTLALPVFGPAIQLGSWMVVMQLDDNSRATAKALRIDVLSNGVLHQSFHNTTELRRSMTVRPNDHTSQSFEVICDVGQVPVLRAAK